MHYYTTVVLQELTLTVGNGKTTKNQFPATAQAKVRFVSLGKYIYHRHVSLYERCSLMHVYAGIILGRVLCVLSHLSG